LTEGVMTEIAIAHRRGGDHASEGDGMALIFLFKIAEEKRLVFLDRTAL
jgi:hypothetical protein